MSIQEIISEIKIRLVSTFNEIDAWFDKDIELRGYKPKSGGWTINEILEHIGLTNHFLLVLIDKATGKALQNIQGLDLQAELRAHTFHWEELKEVGLHNSFQWIRPEHMEPSGQKSLADVRSQLNEQKDRCLKNLELLKNGEGVLYKTTMTVNGLGKINVYEYIYFLVQHGQRHITQMQKNEADRKALLT